MTGIRERIGWRLRRIADRIDPANTPRGISYSFTFELNEGIRFRTDGKGCPLWYLGETDHQRAYDEADKPLKALFTPGVHTIDMMMGALVREHAETSEQGSRDRQH